VQNRNPNVIDADWTYQYLLKVNCQNIYLITLSAVEMWILRDEATAYWIQNSRCHITFYIRHTTA